MQMQPFFHELLCHLRFPQGEVHHVHRGVRVIFAFVMPGEVPDQGTDLKPGNLLPFDLMDEPCIDIQLLFPLSLVLHHCPRRGELVVHNLHSLGSFFLEIDLT